MSARAASASIFDFPTAPTKNRTTRKAATNGKAKGRIATRRKNAVADGPRTSDVLLDILLKNPDLETFTVEKLLSEIGTSSFGTALMFFSIPEVIPIPIPGMSAIVVLPTGILSAQMIAGQKQVRLPKFLLERVIPRKAVAASIHAILPFLKKAEKVTKPRWQWATTPQAQRLIGIFVFLLAASIAFPMPGFNMAQAIGMFIIGLGLVEKDGLLVCAGVLVGLLGVVLLGAVVFGLGALLGF
jgi:hypothetical protein